ncbi:MAG: hypothetical protein CMN05_14885 [Roseibacillus sp.]|nr:hypothetical protein [Roseibacillus sp.]
MVGGNVWVDMKTFVVVFAVLLVAVCSAQAGTFKGNAKYKTRDVNRHMEFVLIYDEGKSEGLLSWRSGPNRARNPAAGAGELSPAIKWDKAKFVVTRKGRIGHQALVGYAVHVGYPITLRIFTYENGKKEFEFYNTYFPSDMVIRGLSE